MKLDIPLGILWDNGRIRQCPITNRFVMAFKPQSGDVAGAAVWTNEEDAKTKIWLDGALSAWASTISGDEFWIMDAAGFLRGYHWNNFELLGSVPFIGSLGRLITLANGTIVFVSFYLGSDGRGYTFKCKPVGGPWGSDQTIILDQDLDSRVMFDVTQGPNGLIVILQSMDARAWMCLSRYQESGGVITLKDNLLEYIFRGAGGMAAGEFPTPTIEAGPNSVYATFQGSPQYNHRCCFAAAKFRVVDVGGPTPVQITELPGDYERVTPGCHVLPNELFVDTIEPRYLTPDECALLGVPDCSRIHTHRRTNYADKNSIVLNEMFGIGAWHKSGWIIRVNDNGTFLEDIIPNTLPVPPDPEPEPPNPEPMSVSVSCNKKVYKKNERAKITSICSQVDALVVLQLKTKSGNEEYTLRTDPLGMAVQFVDVKPNWKGNVMVGSTAAKPGYSSAYAATSFVVK